jgi:hypothetical protein
MPDSKNQPAKSQPSKVTKMPPKRPRKSVDAKVKIASEILYSYFYNMSEKFEATVGRIGALAIMTSRHQDIHTRFETWIGAELSQISAKTDVIQHLLSNELEGIDANIALFDINTPEEFEFTWRVTHPLFWRISEAISKLDKATSDYENLWVLGFITDSSNLQVQGLCRNTIKNLYKRMRYVAYKSANRQGGLFSDEEYQAILKDLNVDVSQMVSDDDSEMKATDEVFKTNTNNNNQSTAVSE